MDLELSDDQEFFRDTTRRFIQAEAPLARIRSGSGETLDRVWWQRAAALGWTAMLASEESGGGSLSGRPLADAAIVVEEMGRMTTPGPFLPVNVVVAALSASETSDHRTVLTALVAGESVAAWALGEPGNRWAVDDLTATARPEGGDVVVSGVKHYVESADVADHLLVVARTDDGLTQVLVPVDHPGVTVVPATSLDLSRQYAEVRLDAVRLPDTAVVGEVGGAAASIERQLQIALVLQSAETVGALDRVFEFTLEYMGDRHAFGRPISSYQALKHRVADLLLMLETAKGCVDAAVRSFDEGSARAGIEASIAKSTVGGSALHIIQECMQFHGGISVTWEHDIHLYLRRATVNRAVYGTPEQHYERICSLLGL